MPVKSSAKLKLLSLLVALSASACSPLPPKPALPAPAVKDSVIPALSPELSKEPLPSGSYWGAVTQWRKEWGDTLKTLPPK